MDPRTIAGKAILRNALLIEAAGNVFGGAAMLAFPHWILSSMTHASSPITPTAVHLVQWLGGLVVALATPLLLSYPNTAAGIASRYTTYWTLGAGEVCLVTVMAFQAYSGSAFTGNALAASIAVLGGTLAWRVWCLAFRPAWVGSVAGANKSL